MDISKKILSNPVNKWLFSNNNKCTYLVGGYVRDLLLGHLSKDKDFIVTNNPYITARKASIKFQGTFIALNPPDTYRVVLRNKVGTTLSREVLDFSSLNGSINNDLAKRDFTINSIAWSPEAGLIDPVGGLADLKKNIVRTARMKNLVDDPLRVLRAYRIAAETGFQIDKKTRASLKRYARQVVKVKHERITDEIFNILSNVDAMKYINLSYQDNVLGNIFGLTGSGASSSLSNKIKLLMKFDSYLKLQLKNRSLSSDLLSKLNRVIGQGLSNLGLIRLYLLLNYDVNLHARIKTSNRISEAIKDIHSSYKHIVDINNTRVNRLSEQIIFDIFKLSGNEVFNTAVIFSFLKNKNIVFFYKKVDAFIKIKNKILLNGNDIQTILKIKQGHKVGKILETLKDQQYSRTVKTKAEAKKWVLLNYT